MTMASLRDVHWDGVVKFSWILVGELFLWDEGLFFLLLPDFDSTATFT